MGVCIVARTKTCVTLSEKLRRAQPRKLPAVFVEYRWTGIASLIKCSMLLETVHTKVKGAVRREKG